MAVTAGIQDQLATGLLVKGVRLQEQALAGKAAQQIGLGQGRALIGRIGLVADHGDGAGKAFGAQGLDRLHARLPRANNDNLFGHGFSGNPGGG